MDGRFNFNGLPTRYVPEGGEFTRYGVKLVCVKRPRVECISAACRGCWFSKGRKFIDGRFVVVNCDDIACSSFDRMDRKNVWFVEPGEVK